MEVNHILVVEDDPAVRNLIVAALEAHGLRHMAVETAHAAIAAASSQAPSIVLLDLGLPDMDGVKVVESVRTWSGMPIIVVSARSEDADKIRALDAGADDYLVKPFALEELHARIRALLRRHNNQGESELIVGNLTLNMGRRQVWMGGEELILTPKEYALLSRLMLKAGSPVHREILYNDIYNWDNEPSTNTLEVHIHNLRDKVGKARIRTVRGFGYMLVANEEN